MRKKSATTMRAVKRFVKMPSRQTQHAERKGIVTQGLQKKTAELQKCLKEAEALLVAFSGGVDSSFLLTAAANVLGDRVVAATAVSPIHPSSETEVSRRFTDKRGIKHLIIESREMAIPAFTENGPDRCYHCKKSLFRQLRDLAEKEGLSTLAHGANMDDLKDYRPGFRAAEEMDVWAPLMETGFRKEDIRQASKKEGLSCWNKPSGACLATRIPYGHRITLKKLDAIEKAEAFLLSQGLLPCRVRHHDAIARIEVDQEGAEKLHKSELKQAVVAKFRELGFLHIALDLEDYHSGNMNRAIGKGSLQGRTKDGR